MIERVNLCHLRLDAGDNIYIPQEYDGSAIPGEAGVDYPVLHEVPDTSFQCKAQEHPGLYADTQAQCQVRVWGRVVCATADEGCLCDCR